MRAYAWRRGGRGRKVVNALNLGVYRDVYVKDACGVRA